MMRTLFVAWALLAIAVQGRREESQSSGEGKQSQLDGTESAANVHPRKSLVALLLALSHTEAFTLGPGGSRAVGQRISSNITTRFNHGQGIDEADVKGNGDEAAELPAEVPWKRPRPNQPGQSGPEPQFSRRAALANGATALAAGALSSPVFAYAGEGTMSKEEVLRIAEERLTPFERHLSLLATTEPPFTGKTTNGFSQDNKVTGTYVGAISGAPVFSSNAKYDSGTGRPSFYAAVPGGVIERPDPGDLSNPQQAEMMGGIRTEIIDAKSGAHLGYVFNDGPKPTGKRYVMNAGAMTFVPDKTSDFQDESLPQKSSELTRKGTYREFRSNSDFQLPTQGFELTRQGTLREFRKQWY